MWVQKDDCLALIEWRDWLFLSLWNQMEVEGLIISKKSALSSVYFKKSVSFEWEFCAITNSFEIDYV